MKRNIISDLKQRSRWTFLKYRAPCAAARSLAANGRSPPRGPPTAASPALWGAAPPPSASALPHAALPTAAAPNRADQVPWPPIRSSGHSMRPDQPLAACSRPQMTDVDVLPSDTSWLFEPTTGVHQFGGGSPRQISASFLAKRQWPTSVGPRSISSIEKTLAAACS